MTGAGYWVQFCVYVRGVYRVLAGVCALRWGVMLMVYYFHDREAFRRYRADNTLRVCNAMGYVTLRLLCQ